MKKIRVSWAIGATLAVGAIAMPVSAAPVKNIVLVHGAWVDASGWRSIHDILTHEGFNVSMRASHAVFESHPKEVAAVIARAARQLEQ